MIKPKERDFAFQGDGKESIQERLKTLFKGRSLRQASIDWNLPYSTLNNYFSKGATPGLDVVIRIAEIEGVSIGWLASGKDDLILVDEAHRGTNTNISHSWSSTAAVDAAFTAVPATSNHTDDAGTSLAWHMIYEALSQSDRVALISLFLKIGAKGILDKMQYCSEADTAWERLNAAEKERLIRLHDQMKKGSPEVDRGVAEADLPSDSKKVG